jgi:hypothetical protein
MGWYYWLWYIKIIYRPVRYFFTIDCESIYDCVAVNDRQVLALTNNGRGQCGCDMPNLHGSL